MPTSDYAWGLTPEQEPRRTCLWLIENETFDRFVLLVILANCVLMALDVPTGVSPSLGIFIAEANIFFLGFYTVELLIRVVAVGLHSRPGGFFTDSFAVFEGLIVLVSWLAQLIPGEAGARSIARSFRALRVLLVLNDIPGMQQLVKAALQVLPSVSNVSGLCFGILLIMGVTGVQFFRGAYHFRCADDGLATFARAHGLALRARGELEQGLLGQLARSSGGGVGDGGVVGVGDDVGHAASDYEHDHFAWQQRFDTTQTFCFADASVCPAGTFCYEFERNPDHTPSFDSVFEAAFPMLQTFLLDAWADGMYSMMEAYGWVAALYFVSLAILGGFLVLQLFLAVIADTFVAIEKRRKAELAAVQPGAVSGADLVYSSDAGDEDAHTAGAAPSPVAAVGGLIDPPATESATPCDVLAAAAAAVSAHAAAFARGCQPLFNVMVLLNLVLMAMPYHDEPPARTAALEGALEALTYVFLAEFALKLVGHGCAKYWANRWNVLDGTLALISLGESALRMFTAGHPLLSLQLSATLRLLRVLRVLRAVRMVRAWPTMYRNVLAFASAIPQVANLLLLLGCVVFIFAIIGMQIFGATELSAGSHEHFDAFGPACLTVFNIFAVGFVDIATACHQAAGLLPTSIYFIPALLIGYLGMMNLFVAILLETFDATRDDDSVYKTAHRESERARVEIRESLAPALQAAASFGEQAGLLSEQLRKSAITLSENDEFELAITCLICLSSICLVLDGPRADPRYACAHLSGAQDGAELAACEAASPKPYLDGANFVFTAIFTLEAALKLFALGSEYFRKLWNVIDFSIVCTSLLSLLALVLPGAGLSMFRSLRVLRVLRPLRLLIRNPNMKVVVETLAHTLPAVLNVLAFVLALMGLFAIVGLRLFSGTFGSCTDADILTRAECHAALSAVTPAPLALLSNRTGAPRLQPTGIVGFREFFSMAFSGRAPSEGPRWVNPDCGHFDSFGDAMLALFTAMTGDNMPDLMWVGMDAVGVDVAPVRTDWSFGGLYFLAWHVIGSFMALNLFVGAIVDKFGDIRKEADGTSLLSPAQLHWVNLLREMRSISPVSVVHEPHKNTWFSKRVRVPMYHLARSRRFEFFMYFVILFNLVVLCWDYYRIEEAPSHYALYTGLTYLFRLCYLLEFLVKLVGLGANGYFRSATRLFEFGLLVATALELLAAYFHVPPMALRLLRIVRVLRILRLTGDRHLRRTRELLHTLMLSMPALLNVASVLMLVMFIYAVLGMQLFPFVMHGDGLNDHANFESFGAAFLILFQVLTGDGWSTIMRDAAVDPSRGCDAAPADGAPTNCGTSLAIPYFVSFVLIGAFVFLNLVVAVVLESFGTLREWKSLSEEAESEGRSGLITSDHIIEFRELWAEYSAAAEQDNAGDDAILRDDLPSLVAQLSHPLGIAGKDGKQASALDTVEVKRLQAAAGLKLRMDSAKDLTQAVVLDREKEELAARERAREREAIEFCLQVRGLRGEKHNTNILEFHRTLTALVRHSFEMGFGVASPAELLPASKRDADCITYRELVVDDDDDDDTPQQQDTFRAALRQMLPEARQPMRSVPEDDEVSEDGTGRSDVVWLPLVKSTAAAPAGSSDPLVA